MADQRACATQSDPVAGVRAVRGEKGGAEIEALLPYRADSRDFLRPVRFSIFKSRKIRDRQDGLSDKKIRFLKSPKGLVT